MNDNVIGVVGGMGSYATAHFFRKLLDEFPAEKEWDRPRIVIDNNCVMPSRVRAILYGERMDELVTDLSKSVNDLVASGCKKLILACITSHYFLKQLKIEQPEQIEFIDLLESTASVVKEKKLYICCTEGTTQTKLWNQYFDVDTELIYPSEEELKKLRFFIEVVKQNKITDDSVEEFEKFIQVLPCKNIILGCTELPVIYEYIKDKVLGTYKVIYDPLQCGINRLKERMIL